MISEAFDLKPERATNPKRRLISGLNMRRHWSEILLKLACVTAFWIMYSCKCSCVAFWTTYDCNGRILAHIVTLWTMAASIRQLTLGCKCSLVNGYILDNARLHLQYGLVTFCILFAMVASTWAMYDCMYSMATFWTLCSCKYSGQGGIWVQVFIGHNLHDATCKYIDSRLLNGAHTHT